MPRTIALCGAGISAAWPLFLPTTFQFFQRVTADGLDQNHPLAAANLHYPLIRLLASHNWITCGHNRSTIKNFYGAGQDDSSRTEPFILEADEPPVLLGTDKAPDPVEYLLHALAACVTTSLVYHAAAKGINIEEVESRLEGDIDLHGFLGLDDNVPRGYKNIRIKFKIKADVPDDQLEELCRLGPTYSPVFNTVTSPVNVEVSLDK